MKIEYFTKEQLKSMSKNELVRMYLKVTDLVNKSYADYEKVVRCKDCKHVRTDATMCLVCGRDGMGLRPYHVYHDDHCSYAERKEE